MACCLFFGFQQCLPPVRIATTPGVQANHVPKENLVNVRGNNMATWAHLFPQLQLFGAPVPTAATLCSDSELNPAALPAPPRVPSRGRRFPHGPPPTCVRGNIWRKARPFTVRITCPFLTASNHLKHTQHDPFHPFPTTWTQHMAVWKYREHEVR